MSFRIFLHFRSFVPFVQHIQLKDKKEMESPFCTSKSFVCSRKVTTAFIIWLYPQDAILMTWCTGGYFELWLWFVCCILTFWWKKFSLSPMPSRSSLSVSTEWSCPSVLIAASKIAFVWSGGTPGKFASGNWRPCKGSDIGLAKVSVWVLSPLSTRPRFHWIKWAYK